MDAADHNGNNDGEEYFADGTPLPADPTDGQALGQAQLLVQMAEDTYRLIRSTDGRTYAVPKLGPAVAVPLASRAATACAPNSPPPCAAAPARSPTPRR